MSPLESHLIVSKPVRAEVDWSVPQRSNEAWAWEPMATGDALVGVGCVRIQGFATWQGTAPKTNETFRVVYDDGDNWYVDSNPVLFPGEEVLVHDVIQDLRVDQTEHLVKFKGHQLAFTTSETPERSQGFISHRNPQAGHIASLRLELARYSTDEPIPCGSTQAGAGRVQIRAFVTSPVDAVLDFHMHQERPVGVGVTGPSQEGDPETRRWWELGIDNIVLKAGVEKMLPVTSAIATNGEGKNTFHFGQQSTPGHLHDEAFCSFMNVPNR